MATRKLGPGAWEHDGFIYLCPGCAADHLTGSPICTREWIVQWAKLVGSSVVLAGGTRMPEGYAERLADLYLEKPWHECE